MAAAALDAQQAERWRHLGAVLCNVHSYYAQFAPHVQRQLDQELRQLEKELQVRFGGFLLVCVRGVAAGREVGQGRKVQGDQQYRRNADGGWRLSCRPGRAGAGGGVRGLGGWVGKDQDC